MSGAGADETAGGKAPLFTREEALGGLTGRRARALMFLIEYWAARLHEEARQHHAAVSAAANLSIYAPMLIDDSHLKDESDSIGNDPDGGFYRAFNLTRDDLPPATGAQIEETAPAWVVIVPAGNPRLNAQVAHMLLRKHAIQERNAIHLRAALALDTEPVQKAHQAIYRQAIANSYAPPPAGIAERLRGLFGR